jgi:hypothetical protein
MILTKANKRSGVDAGTAVCLHTTHLWPGTTHRERSAKHMKLQALATLISVFALVPSCTKEPPKDSGSSINSSQVKTVVLEKLGAYQSKADGLYVISDGLLRVGGHSVDLVPVVESQVPKQGKSIVAMRIGVVVDGVQRPEATFGAIGIADTPQEAIALALGEWYLGFALPLFQAVGEKNPSLVITDYDIFAGTLGLRGTAAQGWVDGSDAMNRKVLDVVMPAVSRQDFVALDLKVMVPPAGQPQSECRINSVVSPEIASRLIALDWPRTADGYMFKQAFVLKKKKPNKITGANAGGPTQLRIRAPWAARIAQIRRWATT